MDNALAKMGFRFPDGTHFRLSHDGKELYIYFATVGLPDVDFWKIHEHREKHGVTSANMTSTREGEYSDFFTTEIIIIFK